jgi:hypothetical protein
MPSTMRAEIHWFGKSRAAREFPSLAFCGVAFAPHQLQRVMAWRNGTNRVRVTAELCGDLSVRVALKQQPLDLVPI